MNARLDDDLLAFASGVSRAAAFAALDAFESGDRRGGEHILLTVLEEDGDPKRPLRCEFCAWTGRWPGERDHHMMFAHPEVAA